MNEHPAGHKKAVCPSCGAEVVFASSVSVFAVCSHCRTMLVRHDMDLESLGEMARIPDDVSPFKVGTRGSRGRDRFAVIGRLKVAWNEGYWNEWFLRFEDGRHGWLAEAMGFLMLSFDVPVTDKVPARKDIVAGKEYFFVPGKVFTADDVRDAECVASEGELPFTAPAGRRAMSVDLSGPDGEFANIEYSEKDVRLYVGRYVTYDEIDWSNLRDLSSDLKKVRAAEQFKCPSCGGPISLLTPGHTAAVVCSYCASTIDATNKHLAVLHKADKKMKIKPLLPIGAKGGLFGTQWEVTGFLRRTDGSGNYPWDEYLLFNPYRGFRWLTTADGHWNFVEMLRGGVPASRADEERIRFQGSSYRKFLVGKAKVAYVLGELYWRVQKGDTVSVADFIAPPEILSREADGAEIVWSRGRYLEPSEVQKAFKLPGEMRTREGVAPNQPSPVGRRLWPVILAFAVLASLLTALEISNGRRALDLPVFNETFAVDPAAPQKAFSTASFFLPKDLANLQVRFQAPVSNDWMEASFSLVDDATQQSVDFELGAEYYFGTDSDGPWSEGSGGAGIILSAVPGGTYHLVVHPVLSSPTTPVRSFTVSVLRDVSHGWNYLPALLLLALYPAYVGTRHRRFEQRRWEDSDFSPYAGGDDDE